MASLFDRVVLAFTKLPPTDAEIAVLSAIAEHPDRAFDFLARQIDKRGAGYVNLAVGRLCKRREPDLGPAPPSSSRPGEKNYSALLIDFRPHDEEGRTWHGWTLKPEALAALRELGII
jgi:hypothetical protein